MANGGVPLINFTSTHVVLTVMSAFLNNTVEEICITVKFTCILPGIANGVLPLINFTCAYVVLTVMSAYDTVSGMMIRVCYNCPPF